MIRIQFLLLSFLLLVCSSVSAQSNYPIYVTPTLTPPYSLKLSDYGAVGSQHLMVQINVNDLNIVDLPVKLHIKLETAGVTIETPPTITTTPIYLNGGVTSILFGEDLADYFHINNLIFKGYSKDAYKRSGQLPGGFYKFTVEVLHYNTNRLISNSGTTSAWIVLGKPPVLQLPEQGAEMGQYPGMPLSFSWLASNVGSPVSVGTIQYTFELWEMRVEGVDPNTVVQSIPVFHEESTFNTFCQIYPATLMMEPGMRYAWRITAKDASGYVPFEQDGHSQVRTFIYKAKCEDVSQLKAGARGRSATFTWDMEPNHTSFNVELRQPSTGWMLNSETYDSKAAFFDLDQGQVYEMRVQAVCNADPSSVSDYSEWTSVKIPVQQPLIDTLNCPTCGCDDNLPQVNLTNFELRDDLAPGDTLINKTGTTRFILHKVEPQGESTFTGIFYYWAEIWGIKFVCEYDNLQVNTDNVIVNMNFESVYDPQFLLDADALSDYLGDLADNIATVTTGMEVKDTLKVDEPFDAIYVNDQGEVVAVTVDADGKVDEKVIGHTSDLDKTLVTDEDGKEYVISGNGQAMGVEEFKATGGNSRLVKKHNQEKEANNLAQGGMVGFSALAKQHYGFDAFDEHKQAIQQHYTPLNNGYRPAWKSLQAFGADQVEADNYNNIVFKDEMGLPAVATSAGLSLRGSFDGAEVPLYAYRDTNTIVGKLNMVSYAPKTLKLIIVPVNKAQMPDAMKLQTTLNTIYKQAVVSWQVEPVNTPVKLDFPGGQMTHGGSGGFSTYNADQKAIMNAFIGQGNVIDKNAFYLFFVEGVKNKERSISGYMPLQRQIGFIYDNPNNTIIAHELAHGAFNLYHTFSEHGFIAPEGATQNLMDYATGASQLWKHQWDKIHNPENIVFGFMQDEKEGESILYPINPMYSRLFDLVYKNCYNVSPPLLSYPDRIQEALKDSNSIELSYSSDEAKSWSEEEKEWIDSWRLRVKKPEDVLKETYAMEAIKSAYPDSKIGKILLQSKKIYLGTYQIGINSYTIALYGDGDETNLSGKLLKRVVSDVEMLADASNIESVYCDDKLFGNYLVIAFYEDGKKQPSMMMQIMPNAFSLSKTKEGWLEHLGIYRKSIEGKTLDEILMTNNYKSLSADEISIVRGMIKSETNVEKRKEYYLKLQEKVEYKSQRDNNPSKHKEYQTCNVTSLAMNLEALGVSNPNPDIYPNFADYLESFSITEGKGSIYSAATWSKRAEELGVKSKTIMYPKDFKKTRGDMKQKFIKPLEEGKSVSMSLYSKRGHIVRLQGEYSDGLIIDDPYGICNTEDCMWWREYHTVEEYKEIKKSVDAGKKKEDVITVNGQEIIITQEHINRLNATYDCNVKGGGDVKGNDNRYSYENLFKVKIKFGVILWKEN